METKNEQQFLVQTEEFEVIGSGEMPTSPIQCGEWWVMPAEQYKGKIPIEIQQKMFAFLNQGCKYKGLLIADDMRKVEKEKPKVPVQTKTVNTPGVDVGAIFAGIFQIMFSLLLFDPMLIAVLDDGRWICLGTWFD